jgi:hypothetical protein
MDDSTSILNLKKERKGSEILGAREALLSDQTGATVVGAQAVGHDKRSAVMQYL